MGTNIKELFILLQTQMKAELSTSRYGINHTSTKGDTTELNWINWLKTYLPLRYSVDKAFIIDCESKISEQIDLVIYDQQYSPFVFKQNGAIYIPAESVYAIFEVKQTLNKYNIEYAGKKAESVRVLERTSAPIYHAGGRYKPKSHKKILAGILTLSSDWDPPLGKSFEKCIKNLSESQSLNFGCSIECGAFEVNSEKEINKSTTEETLIFFFLKLLIYLQKMGTVPALDIKSYADSLDSI